LMTTPLAEKARLGRHRVCGSGGLGLRSGEVS
jgi:hypothetical protein